MWFLVTDVIASAAVEVNLLMQLHFSRVIGAESFYTLTLHLQSGRHLLRLCTASHNWGLLLQVRHQRVREEQVDGSSPHNIPPPPSLDQAKEGSFCGGSRPRRCSRNSAEDEELDVCPVLKQPLKPGWSISASPSSPCTPSSLRDNFLCHVSLSIPPHPGPPHCQALERSRISVCFDYRGCPGDVSQAGQSPSAELAACVSAASPHEQQRMHESNLLMKHTLILHLFIIGSFSPPPPSLLIDPPTLSFLMSSCSNVGFRFGRLMELAQGSAAQGWGGDRYITSSNYY